MNINGKFSRVSDTTWRDGVVLVGFCGDAYPHDLKLKQIEYIKTFYMMPKDCEHEVFLSWPDGVNPAYPAAKANFKNGFLLLKKTINEGDYL